MSTYIEDPDVTIHQGDALQTLRQLDAESVHMAATSPPFWALRDYLVAGQIGLEETPDEWATALVNVFREVRRVLRNDGTLWIECGDVYDSGTKASRRSSDADHGQWTNDKLRQRARGDKSKPKDLVGAPWLLALALRADGWYLRQTIIWHKPNAMPESATDRPTTSHSYVFLLSASPRYYYDQDAIREPYDRQPETDGFRHSKDYTNSAHIPTGPDGRRKTKIAAGDQHHDNHDSRDGGERWPNLAGRNARSVWSIPTQPYKGDHYATWPEALVSRMIEAGTSEHGVCGACGAPLERQVTQDLTDVPTRTSRVRAPIDLPAMADYLKRHREAAQLTKKQVDEHLGTKTLYSWFEGRPAGYEAPTPEQWAKLKPFLRLGDDFDEAINGTVSVVITDHGGRVEGDTGVRRYKSAWDNKTHTTGWEPTCECGTLDTKPATVLDPFAGAGTTLLAARNHGRRSIGIELNPDYCHQAAQRLQQLSLLTEVTT